MPYVIRKRGNRYAILRTDTMRTVGTAATKAKAQASVRARLAADHALKPSKRRR